MQKIKLAGGRTVSCDRIGNLLGETVVLVHSHLFDRNMWESQIKTLEEEYDCITIDLCGHGDADALNSDKELTLRDLAQDVLDVVDTLGILYFHYIGIGVGAMLAPYINDMCKNIESFTIIDGYVGTENSERKEKYLNIINEIEKQGEITSDLAKAITPIFFIGKDENIISNFEKRLMATPKENIATICKVGKAICNRDSAMDLLKNITAKTSFMVAEQSFCISQEEVEEMSKTVANSHVYIIEDAGHICNIENAERVNKILARMFDVDESSKKKSHFFI